MKNILIILSIGIILTACGGQEITEATPENTQPETSTEVSDSTEIEALTMAEVETANNEEYCLTVVDGKIYDLTSFFGKHPGGDENLAEMCGRDASEDFEAVHGGNPKPEMKLDELVVGEL